MPLIAIVEAKGRICDGQDGKSSAPGCRRSEQPLGKPAAAPGVGSQPEYDEVQGSPRRLKAQDVQGMNPHGVVVTLQHRPHREGAQGGAAEKDCQGKPALRRLQPRRTQTPAQVQQAVQGHQKSQVPILGLLIKNAPKPFCIKLVKRHGHSPAEHVQIGDIRGNKDRAEQPRQADALPFRFPKAPRSG